MIFIVSVAFGVVWAMAATVDVATVSAVDDNNTVSTVFPPS